MTERPIQKLIHHLYALAREEDRGALATLRSALRDGNALAAASIVFPFLPPTASRREEDDALLLASLFALHPEVGSESVAAALRSVHAATKSDSIEARFRALLSTERVELASHLRNAVALIASNKRSLDWVDLYDAIRHWHFDGPKSPKRRWARDYWRDQSESAVTDPSSPETPA
jgi:CRISPR system Cascade subunit CasB